MAKLINIGFGNAVNADKIQCVVNPDAAPIKRMVQHAREEDRVVDATQGRKTKVCDRMRGGPSGSFGLAAGYDHQALQ